MKISEGRRGFKWVALIFWWGFFLGGGGGDGRKVGRGRGEREDVRRWKEGRGREGRGKEEI